tara:strand:- start:11824 stop:12363 length:540 start_codon:yes stop_codon:yes gene_type:complete
MALFDLKNGHIVLNPESLALPGFREIWKKDKTKGKEKATQEISYIYFMCDYNSPYAVYPNIKRREVIAKDYMQDEKWVETEDVKVAVKRYLDFQETHTMRLMRAAKGASDKLAGYFETIDFLKVDDNGKPIYTAKDVAVNLEKVGNIVDSLDKLETRIKKEVRTDSRVRGGGEIGMYER